MLAAGISPPKRVYGHGWILSGEEKMSKSTGNILDPIEIIKKYGLDQLRYYLVKEVSFGNDGNISTESIESCINSDLANNFGNFCQRTLSFAEKNCNNQVPKNYNFLDEDNELLNSFSLNLSKIRKDIDNQNLNEYIKFIIARSFDSNKYFNDSAPWSKKEKLERLNTIIYVSLEVIRKLSILLFPIIPQSAEKSLKSLNVSISKISLESINNHEFLTKGGSLNNQGILFKKIINK